MSRRKPERFMNAGSNPLLDRIKVAEQTTINGVPVARLGRMLPPPHDCPECGFPVWDLNDPHARPASDGTRTVPTAFRAEWSSVCFTQRQSRSIIDLLCDHPYHLVKHQCSVHRPHPALPSGLINPHVR